MLSLSRFRLVLGLAFLGSALFVLPLSEAGAQAKKKGNSKPVRFETHDGVTISGTLYPNPGGKREAVVILLHNFNLKDGGSSDATGWAGLANDLQADGYAVLTFDFRGFGDSKQVDKAKFWNAPHNNLNHIPKGRNKDSIEYSNFRSSYLVYLVNDIAAAKAYLDRRNDDKEVNTSNVVVIGAGDAASLGLLWMANETRRRKDQGALPIGPPQRMGEPESRDLAAGVFLSISPNIGGRTVGGGLSKWAIEAGRYNKVPMVFVFGAGDARGANLSRSLSSSIKSNVKKETLKHTGVKSIADTKLTGNALLDKDLGARSYIVKEYLAGVMEDRGARERSERKATQSRYVYTTPWQGSKTPTYYRDNKPVGEAVPAVDITLFGFNR